MAAKWTVGHTSTVLCLNANSEGLVASGAESGELAIWSSDGTCVGQVKLEEQEDVACVAFSPLCPSRFYAAHGEKISIWDSRCLKIPTDLFHINEDEINCLRVNETDALLAAADDSGAIKIFDLMNRKVSRTLRRHTNICSSLSFRPGRPQSLVSCGLDMQVMLWNLQKARPLFVINLQELAHEEEEQQQNQQATQLLNPPLAHSITVARCGNIFATGAEDGKVRVFRVAGTKFEQEAVLQGHSMGVSHVHFLDLPSHPYYLVSGGNDGKILLWDFESLEQNKVLQKSFHRRNRKNSKKGQYQKMDTSDTTESHKDQHSDSSLPKMSINHGEKVNWLCATEANDVWKLLVADQTNTISVYSLPEF
ncbi:WD repeat-containing protein 53 isoform X1 [Protopterus annectens]|uniref:WD repeat-containing protein 53 isoform X1 n=1 Tax=Protopterus annectens TaxID=7888 RepID=UPI001CFAA7AA|nr:WD repeat-containing protein 53 isoform X1 [Protopterus annectens]XP_043925550.1 WD repeat-containing protein 53 isoform X1 [Protopterus annectens]